MHKSSPSPDQFDIWIEPGGAKKHYWLDLWRYRELFLMLAWRDVAIRYKQTIAGAAWAVIQPALSIFIMTLIFGKIARLPSESNAPYALMIVAGALPWQFFANGLSSASQSIVADAALLSKVYFPRIIIPCGSLVAALVDFFVSCVILAALMVWYQFAPSWRVLALPFLVVLSMVAALGPSLIIAALAVRYRDFRFVIPFIAQFGLYVSPVAYSSALIREKFGDGWFLLYSLNPMAGVIDGFRWAILGTSTVHWIGFSISMAVAALLVVVGIGYFRKTERSFADVI